MPQFINRNKIKIINDDALRYLENHHNFDYYFADLWHNPNDGISLYLRLENLAKINNIKINYWLEESLKSMKRRCLITILEEYFLGYSEKDYKYSKNNEDQIINHLYLKYKNINIETENDLKNILD